MNPVEVWSGIAERQAIRPSVFKSVKGLTAKTRTFIDGGNDRCHPFVWTKTTDEVLKKANPKKTPETNHQRRRSGPADKGGPPCCTRSGAQAEPADPRWPPGTSCSSRSSDVDTSGRPRVSHDLADLADFAGRLTTDHTTAELVEAAAHAFLATRISFITAMTGMCGASGADVIQLATIPFS